MKLVKDTKFMKKGISFTNQKKTAIAHESLSFSKNPKAIKRIASLPSLMKKGIVTIIKVNSIVYDENLDILELDNGLKTSYCIEIGDLLVVHCDNKNKIVGLELLGISQINQIEKDVLNNIKSAQIILNTIPQEKKTVITVKLLSVIEKNQTTTNIVTTQPIESPLMCH